MLRSMVRSLTSGTFPEKPIKQETIDLLIKSRLTAAVYGKDNSKMQVLIDKIFCDLAFWSKSGIGIMSPENTAHTKARLESKGIEAAVIDLDQRPSNQLSGPLLVKYIEEQLAYKDLNTSSNINHWHLRAKVLWSTTKDLIMLMTKDKSFTFDDLFSALEYQNLREFLAKHRSERDDSLFCGIYQFWDSYDELAKNEAEAAVIHEGTVGLLKRSLADCYKLVSEIDVATFYKCLNGSGVCLINSPTSQVAHARLIASLWDVIAAKVIFNNEEPLPESSNKRTYESPTPIFFEGSKSTISRQSLNIMLDYKPQNLLTTLFIKDEKNDSWEEKDLKQIYVKSQKILISPEIHAAVYKDFVLTFKSLHSTKPEKVITTVFKNLNKKSILFSARNEWIELIEAKAIDSYAF